MTSRRKEAGQVADQAAGNSTREFGDVGVLLLRHDRRTGREGVVEPHPAHWRLHQKQISSHRRERSTPICAATYRNSSTWSRLATASIEFSHGACSPFLRRHLGRMAIAEPASAAAPSGERAERQSQSMQPVDVTAQRLACASSWWPNTIGCAGCRCVKPGASVVLCCSACCAIKALPHRAAGRQQACVFAQVQPQIVRGLVVARGPPAACRRVRPGARQHALDEGVHVFVARRGPSGRRRCRFAIASSSSDACVRFRRRRAGRRAEFPRVGLRRQRRSWGQAGSRDSGPVDRRISAGSGPLWKRPPQRRPPSGAAGPGPADGVRGSAIGIGAAGARPHNPFNLIDP